MIFFVNEKIKKIQFFFFGKILVIFEIIFTKAMAERLMEEERGRLPVSVVRPTMVAGAVKEPIPGWVVNLDGPTRNCLQTCQRGEGYVE